jgi:two-component sensor histidine kinase
MAISAEAGQTLAMVVHGLATNAAQFGALTTDKCSTRQR